MFFERYKKCKNFVNLKSKENIFFTLDDYFLRCNFNLLTQLFNYFYKIKLNKHFSRSIYRFHFLTGTFAIAWLDWGQRLMTITILQFYNLTISQFYNFVAKNKLKNEIRPILRFVLIQNTRLVTTTTYHQLCNSQKP